MTDLPRRRAPGAPVAGPTPALTVLAGAAAGLALLLDATHPGRGPSLGAAPAVWALLALGAVGSFALTEWSGHVPGAAPPPLAVTPLLAVALVAAPLPAALVGLAAEAAGAAARRWRRHGAADRRLGGGRRAAIRAAATVVATSVTSSALVALRVAGPWHQGGAIGSWPLAGGLLAVALGAAVAAAPPLDRRAGRHRTARAVALPAVLAPVLVTVGQRSPALLVASLALTVAAVRGGQVAAGRTHAADHDPLTGLANRRRLEAAADRALERSRRRGEHLAVVLIDLDGFKPVNDRLGHAVGDGVLVEIGRRLNATCRDGDLVARLGGDEFAVLAPDARSAADAALLAGRLVDAVSEPMTVQGHTVRVGASAGVAVCPDHGRSAWSLMRRADAAMYEAKASGGAARVWQPGGPRPSVRAAGAARPWQRSSAGGAERLPDPVR